MVNKYFSNSGNIPGANLRQENKTRLGTQKAADAPVIRNKVLESFLVFCSTILRWCVVPIVGSLRLSFFRIARYDVHIGASDKTITIENVRV